MKRLLFCLVISACFLGMIPVSATVPEVPENAAKAYILVENATGNVLCEKNPHGRYAPASVTKIMTLLLVAEAVDSGQYSLEDVVTASEHASGMGGSQIWLEPGETMTVGDLIKTVAVVSANDSAVALAEYTAGSETAFVEAMNAKAAYLGMTDTHFENCTGLEAEGHLTSANDIAVMARELIKHDWIFNYTTIWTDSIRNGESELTNTNKLVKSYPGITGLKTGYTQTAKYCLAATARRDGMDLIAVTLGGETSTLRFEAATSLLNYGFANYQVVDLLAEDGAIPECLPVINGQNETADLNLGALSKILILKSAKKGLRYEYDLPESLIAPVEAGQVVGEFRVWSGEELIAKTQITTSTDSPKQTFFQVWCGLMTALLS
ncbi:MAG: D-alanyl-D-alanine carboxypeptidase [Clostridia bacterium]|nr:D-alanyl-D-alanine carboxypeptidase [Clostridia bacterium]